MAENQASIHVELVSSLQDKLNQSEIELRDVSTELEATSSQLEEVTLAYNKMIGLQDDLVDPPPQKEE